MFNFKKNAGMQDLITIVANGQEFEITFFAKNKTTSKTATNVVSHIELPTGVQYVSHTIQSGNGTFNTSSQDWTIASLTPRASKSITVKYKVTDITLLNLTITQDITINEAEDILDDNHRIIWLMKKGLQRCDPATFITPAVGASDDDLYERMYIGDNDSVDCPCCTSTYELVVGSEINVTVVGFGPGYANVIRDNPYQDSYFDYKTVCKDCIDGKTYKSSYPVTAKINKLFTGWAREYKGVFTQYGTSAPTVRVARNSTGGTISWTRLSTGLYEGTISSGTFYFESTLCFAQVSNGNTTKEIKFSRHSDTKVRLSVIDTQANAYVDADMTDVSISIEAYTPAPQLSPTVTPSISITPSLTATPSITPTVTSSHTVTPTTTPSTTHTPSVTPSHS